MHRNVISKIVAKARLSFSSVLVTVLVANPVQVYAQQEDRSTGASSVVEKIKIQRKRRGIDAELVDQGDYYMHPDGREIRMLRKKDVYVVESSDSARSVQRVKNQFGERIKDVANHRLGGRKVVRIDNGVAVKRRRNEQFDVTANMLRSSDNSIASMKPIFANERGDGDILLMPKLTVKLAAGIDPKKALKRLSNRYGLALDRKLRVSGNVYSLSLKSTKTESQQFKLVRSVMNDAMIEWAEPQFVAKAEKTAFVPNDTFFDEQWHLRNTGQQVTRCDTDCDANNAWGINLGSLDGGSLTLVEGSPAVSGTNMVIAIIDDGVQLDHEDINIWNNADETNISDGIDNDGNGYIDDWRGWDFVIDSSTNNLLQNSNLDGSGTCSDGFDGDAGEDNDPSPQATSDCVLFGSAGDDLENDDHGTAVAGLAAAEGNNGTGIAGTAYNAEILPIRLISDFDSQTISSASFCNRAAEAMTYAGAYADVVNNSWSMPVTCSALEAAITNVTSGTVNVNGGELTSMRANGSPVLFASGNQATGWVKVSIPVSAGEHAYEWRFLRNGIDINPLNGDHVWLDDITWPDATMENFEGAGDLVARGFDIGNEEATNTCIDGCLGFFVDAANWDIAPSPEPPFGGSMSAYINAASPAECSNTYLYKLRNEPTSGDISFWVWVDADTSGIGLNANDNFEFLIDGEEVLSFGDSSLDIINGEIAYPASLSGTIDGVIAVGSSNSGDLSGTSAVSLSAESRAFYSQYGPNLDVVAPSSNQQLGIVTTDREGVDGYNDGSESIVDNYTNTFGGTSASTPIVAGIAAAMLAVDTNLSASSVRTILRDTADEIGGVAYTSGRNDFYGYGRVNMYSALIDAGGIVNNISYADSCSSTGETFSFVSAHKIFEPDSLFFCPAIGEVPQEDEMCFPIKTVNNNLAVICF